MKRNGGTRRRESLRGGSLYSMSSFSGSGGGSR